MTICSAVTHLLPARGCIGVGSKALAFGAPAFVWSPHCVLTLQCRCPPEEELYDSMRSGVLLCQVDQVLSSFLCSRSHTPRQIVNKLERREFVAGIELRPKARAQYIHNCKRCCFVGGGAGGWRVRVFQFQPHPQLRFTCEQCCCSGVLLLLFKGGCLICSPGPSKHSG